MRLVLEKVVKRFAGPDGPVSVLDGASLSLGQAETLALTGESGSGKSTLLHIAAGLEPFDAGSVAVSGQDLGVLDDTGLARLRREEIGVVFQQFNLVPSLDVRSNLALQARLAGRYDAELLERMTDRLGISDQLAKYPEQLSGGQQQRVAIGRALAAKPGLILADEPTGNLDETTGDRIFDLFLELVRDAGAALLVVTHSERLASRAERRLTLAHGKVS